jgi:hypothetical protein
MVKTRSTSDEQGDDSIPSATIMEPTLLSIATGLQELSQQFAVMQEKWRAMKLSSHPPPSAHPPPSQQFHTPHANDAYAFHTRAPSHFDPHNHPNHDQFYFQEHPRRSAHQNSHDHNRGDGGWNAHDQIPKWHPPRADLSKFDGTDVMDWIEDCGFFFSISLTFMTMPRFKL